MTAPDQIKKIASILHRDLLKINGFRKLGMTFTRNDEFPKILNIQSSQWNNKDEAHFTINLGVYIDEVHKRSDAYPAGKNIKEYNCDLRERIGSLMSGGCDPWWKVVPNTDTEKLAAEVIQTTSTYALPWFDRCNNMTEAAGIFEQSDPFKAAVAHLILGNTGKAAEFTRAAYTKGNRRIKQMIAEWARKNRIECFTEEHT